MDSYPLHGEPVRRDTDGRTGHAHDIEGPLIHVFWDDGGTDWCHLEELSSTGGELVNWLC